MKLDHPILISFSGVDGAGKSTQIAHLVTVAQSHGLKTTVLTLWDHVAVLSRYREQFAKEVFKSESGVGTQDRPVNRRDKNVRGWHVDLVRHGLYSLDALHLPIVVANARRAGSDVIIFDRYIHDELANLSVENSLSRVYMHAISRMVPQPDIAFVLDADPEAARARKPEYPLDFMYSLREAYLNLANLLGTLTVVPALSLSEAKHVVEISFRRLLQKRGINSTLRMWAA